MTAYPLPAILKVAQIAFNPRGMSVAGSPTMGGITPVTEYDSGYWMASVQLAAMDAGAQVKAFRALRAQLGGGANPLLVPASDEGQTPWPLPGGAEANLNDGIPFSDGTFFVGGVGFFSPSIKVTLAADAALRATAITPTVTTAGDIAGGEYFSIGERLYLLRQVLDNGDWAIWPPLREAVAAGTRLNFDKPVCRMQLTGDSAMDLMLGRLWKGATPSIDLVEAA